MQTERLLSVAAILAQATFACCGSAAQSASPPAPSGSTAVELVKALAWPLATLLIGVVFHRQIALFMSALGSRITKLSLFKVELELVPATAATTTPLLDDIRTATSPAEISDSSRAKLERVQSRAPADFAVIAIGKGQDWLTSRLYLAAVMMARMRSVKAFVFVERSPDTGRRLVGVASVSQLQWALARRYPWLEAAWARVQISLFPQPFFANAPQLPVGAQWLPHPGTLSMPQPVIQSDSGALERRQARQCVSSFIDLIQRHYVPAPGVSDPEWVTLRDATKERASWMTHELLESLLPQEAFNACVYMMRDAPRAKRTRAVLRRADPFVALVESNREYACLATRQALLEEIAASLGQEPEHQ